MRNTRRRGNVLSFFLGLLFGVIIVVGGIFGAGFYAYKKVKVGKFTGGTFSEELSDLSIEQFIKEVTETFKDKDNLTLNKLGELVPSIANLLPEEGISFGTLGKLDVQKLKDIPVSQLSASLSDAIVITATLSSLETEFGATLPDMPFIRGGEEGSEVWSYVPATELNGTEYVVKSDYNQTDLYALVDGEYVIATQTEGENVVVKSEYVGKELWFKTNGLMNVNVIDAVSTLSASLDFETMTLGDMEYKFGINLKDGDEYHPAIKKMLDKKVSELGQMDDVIGDLYLTDVVTVGSDDTYLKAISYKRDADGDLLGRYNDGTTEIEVKVDKDGVPLDETYGTTALPLAGVKVADIEQQVNNVRLKDFLGDQYDESNQIMSAIGNTPIGQIGEKIETLTLVDVMEMENRTLRALAYQKADNGSGEYWYKAVLSNGSVGYLNPAQYEVRADGNFYEIESGTAVAGYTPVATPLSAVGAQVDHLIVRECMEFDSETPHLMYEVADVAVGEIGHALYNMDMRKVLGDEHLTGYIRASKQATRDKEKTGVAVGAWYILPSFEYYYFNGTTYTVATIDQITAKQNLYTFDTTYMHYVAASKLAVKDNEVPGAVAGEWYILPDHEYYYSTDGETFTKATAEQIEAKQNLYIHDLLTFWHFVFHQEDDDGNEIIITINNIGESVDHVAGVFSEAKIGLLYDREIFLLDKAPLEVVRNATVHDVIEAASAVMGI